MRIYLAGPMSGLPEFNYPAFNAEAARLRSLGHEVENPAENTPPLCGTYQGYMRSALRRMLSCECIATLPGWKESRGARIETELAAKLAIPVVHASDFISAIDDRKPIKTGLEVVGHIHKAEPVKHTWTELNPSINKVAAVKNCTTCRHFQEGACQYTGACDATYDLWQAREHG